MKLLSPYAYVITVEADHHLPLFYMAIRFIWINETKQLINDFTIGYMNNLGLNFKNPSENKLKIYVYYIWCNQAIFY